MRVIHGFVRRCSVLLGLLLVAHTVGMARAEEAISGEVFVVLASEQEGEIDAALGNIKALHQAPFNGFRSMKVLTRSDISLQIGKPETVSLPNGRRLMLTLKEIMPDGRSKVQLSINRPDQKDYLPLLEVKAKSGEPFFVAGQKHEGGTLVIGVRVGLQAGAKSADATRSP